MKTNRISMVLLALVLLAAGCGRKNKGAAADVRRLAVRTQPVAARDFERRLSVQGSLEAKNFASVAARVEGNLDAVWVDEGDAVVAGQTPLFQVDPVGRRNALTIAEQNLQVNRAQLAVARASAEKADAEAHKAALDFERYERLHKEGKVTDNEYESRTVAHEQAKAGLAVARAQVDLAERQVRQAEASLSIAQKNFDDTRVVAPISGLVSARRAEPGEQMSVGRVVLRIDDLSTVEAAAFVPAQYYPEVIPGRTTFRLTVNGCDVGTNTVTYRSPTIDTTLRTFEIKGLVGASEGVAVPGNMADLTIVFETRQGIGVPSASVLVRAGKHMVFVVRSGKAVACEVKTGLENDAWTEILSGLEAGEHVVTEGQTQLQDGNPVEVL